MLLRFVRSDWGGLLVVTLVLVLSLIGYVFALNQGKVFWVWSLSFVSVWPIIIKIYNRYLDLSYADRYRKRVLCLRSTANLLQLVIWLWLVFPALIFRLSDLHVSLLVAVIIATIVHGYLVCRTMAQFSALVWWTCRTNTSQSDWLG